jgi:AcrR family transcriptional regulator
MDRSEIERVMEIAAEVFADHGFSGVGMRELCKRCGVGAPTLYHYFGSKEQLFDAVCLQKYKRALSAARNALDLSQSVELQLDAISSQVFDILVGDRVLFLLLRRDLIDGSISGRELRSRPQYDGILNLLRQVVEQRFDADDSQKLAFTLAALIFGYCEFVHLSINLRPNSVIGTKEAAKANLHAALRKLIS